LVARLATLLRENKNIFAKEEVKNGWATSTQIWQNLIRKSMAQLLLLLLVGWD
jgi:hypothetical protein